MNAIKNITIGHTERLYKPVGYTMLANLVNIVPFCLSIEAVSIIFSAFGSGQPLDMPRLYICGNFRWASCPDVTPAICLPCLLRTS